jgi:hypothetical protein
MWNSSVQQFIDVESDIFENRHFNKETGYFEDSVMYIKASIDVDQVGIIKLIKTENSNSASQPVQVDKAAKNLKSLTL